MFEPPPPPELKQLPFGSETLRRDAESNEREVCDPRFGVGGGGGGGGGAHGSKTTREGYCTGRGLYLPG